MEVRNAGGGVKVENSQASQSSSNSELLAMRHHLKAVRQRRTKKGAQQPALASLCMCTPTPPPSHAQSRTMHSKPSPITCFTGSQSAVNPLTNPSP